MSRILLPSQPKPDQGLAVTQLQLATKQKELQALQEMAVAIFFGRA